MSTLAKARQSAVTGKIPTPYQLAFGELAINTTDGVLYFKKTNGITEKIVKLNASEDGVAPIALGGTGSTTAVDARVALGLGTVATQDSDAVAISGGTIDGTPVGATTKSTGGFTDVAMTGMLNAHAPLTTNGYQFSITNESTLPNSWAAYRVGNAPSDSDSVRIGALGKSFTTNGAYFQDAGFIEAGGNLSGGLSVIASASVANFRLYLGGYSAINLRLQIATTGIITGSASTDLLAYTHVLTNANVGQAYSCFYVANGATSADGTGVLTCGTAFTTSGVYVQNGGVLEAGANLSGGLGIMARHASGNMRFYTGGYMAANERMRIDATGKVGINSTAPPVAPSAGMAGLLTLEQSATYVPICAYAYANSVHGGGMLVLGKSRSTVKGTMEVTQANDALGYVNFEGVTTASALASPAAYIQGTQDGAAGATYVPGRLDFYTATAAALASHRMTVTSSGVGIGLGANVAPTATLSIGPRTQTASTAPTSVDFGGQSSSVAGANLKLRLWTNGVASSDFGFGISALQMDYVVPASASHAWWRSTAKSMILDTSDRLLVGVASGNANGGVLQLKSGITFPATQVAATDPNTLDDYEEGTFTPAFSCASPGTLAVTYTNQVGRYTKVGRLVTYNISMRAATLTVGTATGALYITGMPFQSLTLASYVAPAATLLYGLTGAATTPMSAWIGNATTFMRISTNGATAFGVINITDITVPTAEIYISGQYEV